MDENSDPESLVRPSLQLHDVEGRIHKYGGMLSRKTKKNKIKNGWKRRWFRVIPGKNSYAKRPIQKIIRDLFLLPDHHQQNQNLFNFSQSKSTVRNRLGLQKLIITRIPRTDPDITLKPLSQDAESKDFTGFEVHDSHSDAILGTFRAEDIVQQRNFMAALGGSGPGLFTQTPDNSTREDTCDQAKEGLLQIECELEARHLMYDSQVNYYAAALPSYEQTMKQLPKEFYFPQDYRTGSAKFSESEISVYDPSAATSSELPGLHQRRVTDTFLPPYGPPAYCPVSIGYGKEAGLESHQQAIWDTQNAVYYFLNHSTRSSCTNDPRFLEVVDKTALFKKEEFTYRESLRSDFSMPAVCNDSTVVEAAAERATQRPHGFVLKVSKRPGMDGANGTKGLDGEMGYDAPPGVNGDGIDGMDGEPGVKGRNGSDGEKGGSGGDVVMSVTGDASLLNVCVNEQRSILAKLGGESHEEVIFIDSRGSDSGCGGDGGEGGRGGSGGDGSKGGDRGDGGHGGNGGMGAAGGNGGAGGDAGSGGCCVVRTPDPCLLMLVEVDCRAGKQGKGGSGGSGGEGGRMGYGGEGGSWMEPDCSPGATEGSICDVHGMKGKPGSTGTDGSGGLMGLEGRQGRNGGILWMIESPSGEILHQSGAKYEACITSLEVSPVHNTDMPLSDVYQPNQAITVSRVVVKNTGGLPLPRGAKLFFPTTKSVRFVNTVYKLPEIPPNQSITIPESFEGRIFDQSTPNLPGAFSGEAVFTSRIELLGRPFGSPLTRVLPVAYPVNLSFSLSRRDISRGEISVMEVGIENTSSVVAYGSTPGCRGSVSVRLHLDSHLILLGIQKQSSLEEEESDAAQPFRVAHNPNVRDSVWVTITELPPGEILTIPLAFLVDPNARLCDTCTWQSSLYYKGKLVEYKAREIRVAPSYALPRSPSSLGDVLMVTSKAMTGSEFALWQRVFELLDVNVDYWDVDWSSADKINDVRSATPERTVAEVSNQMSPARVASSTSPTDYDTSVFNPIHHHNPFGMYSGKAIVYPHCKLEQIPACHITSHFSSSPSSSMLVFLSSSTPDSLEDYFYDHTGHAKLLRHLCCSEDRLRLPDDSHSGYHFLAPGTLVSPDVSIRKSEKKIMRRLEADSPAQALALFSCNNASINHKSLLRYTYGKMDVRRCPIRRSCNFQCVDGVGGSLTSMGIDDPLLTVGSKEFPLASKFGQVLLSVLVSIPLHCKLNLFKMRDNMSPTQSPAIRFHLPNGRCLTRQDLAAIAVAHAVADEILDCTGSTSRMTLVMEDLQSNRTLYSGNGSAPVLNQMLSLIQLEAAERARHLGGLSGVVAVAVKDIQKFCKSLAIPDSSCLSPGSLRRDTRRLNPLPVSRSRHRTTSLPSLPIAVPPAPPARVLSLMAVDEACVFAATEKILPPLRLLQDSHQVLRTHQLMVEQNCYSLSR